LKLVQALAAERGWDLLDEEALVDRVLATTPDGDPTEAAGLSLRGLQRLAENQYSIDVYRACQDRDSARQERGYRALHGILYRAALGRWPELAEDATQRALVLVCEQIDRCQGPGTFLAFALYKLRHALKQERRARGWDDFLEQEQLHEGRAEAPSMAAELERQERCQAVLAAIRRLPDERACGAIALKFLAGLSDEQIGARLGIKAGHVRVLRHRGLLQLRQDPELQEML
jgi:RNA polymerase sigma factor (sigma-70 family)